MSPLLIFSRQLCHPFEKIILAHISSRVLKLFALIQSPTWLDDESFIEFGCGIMRQNERAKNLRFMYCGLKQREAWSCAFMKNTKSYFTIDRHFWFSEFIFKTNFPFLNLTLIDCQNMLIFGIFIDKSLFRKLIILHSTTSLMSMICTTLKST